MKFHNHANLAKVLNLRKVNNPGDFTTKATEDIKGECGKQGIAKVACLLVIARIPSRGVMREYMASHFESTYLRVAVC